MMPLYEKAVSIALAAHTGQVRKTDQTPYIIHPLTVAHLVSLYTKDEEVIAAAVLHDVLEDSPMTTEQLRIEVGDRVVAIVEAVTEDKTLPWEERKAAYVKQVCAAGEPVWLVSVADKVHNAITLHRELIQKGPEVWNSFNRGREEKLWFENLLLDQIKTKWSHPLVVEYESLIRAIEVL
jgi:(p)ppGpp synthase/HD superfamily hydrolase